MRILTAIEQKESRESLENASTEIWRQIWSYDRDITEDEVLAEALLKAGLSNPKVQEIFAVCYSPEIKKVCVYRP